MDKIRDLENELIITDQDEQILETKQVVINKLIEIRQKKKLKKQKENAEFARAGSPSPNSTSAMSAEQGKKNGGYQMGQIGHNQTRNDALNGVPSGGNAGIGPDSMKQMEKDLSSTRTGMSMDSTNNIAGNKPIEAGGHMFDRVSGSDTSSKNNEPKKPGSKDIFGDNAGRKN